jgi:hypothetical protein
MQNRVLAKPILCCGFLGVTNMRTAEHAKRQLNNEPNTVYGHLKAVEMALRGFLLSFCLDCGQKNSRCSTCPEPRPALNGAPIWVSLCAWECYSLLHEVYRTSESIATFQKVSITTGTPQSMVAHATFMLQQLQHLASARSMEKRRR